MADTTTFDPQAFRQALGAFTTGVTIVTTRGAEGDVGLTANSFNSVSLDPPMILWSLGKSANSLPAFREAENFAVHILSRDQEEISNRFARRGIDKFAGVAVQRGPNDIPLLENCAARFVCRTAYQYEGGDHIIFVGEVLGFDQWQKPPLLFHGGRYGQMARPPDPAQESSAAEYTLGHLLRLCGHRIFRPLKLELARRDLSLSQYFFLSLAGRRSSTGMPEMLRLLELGDGALSGGEIDALSDRGLITVSDGFVALTTEGARLHVELMSLYKASESRVLERLDYDMRQTLGIALLEIIEKAGPEANGTGDTHYPNNRPDRSNPA